MQEEILNYLKSEDLSEECQDLVEVCGLEVMKQLINEYGGVQITIPMLSSIKPLVERYVNKNIKNRPVYKLARDLNLSKRVIRKYINKDYVD